MDETAETVRLAARVHAAKRRVDAAIADLAASPLDEKAADQMSEILASPELVKARRALARLTEVEPNRLRVVPDGGGVA